MIVTYIITQKAKIVNINHLYIFRSRDIFNARAGKYDLIKNGFMI